MDCGPTCLKMVAKHYGRNYNTDTLRQIAGYGRQGVSLLGISETAEKIGFRTKGVQVSYEKLSTAPLPAILHWEQNHFVVLITISKKAASIADPARGIIALKKDEFMHHWVSNAAEEDEQVGTALLLEPTPSFYDTAGEKDHRLNWSIITHYLGQNKRRLFLVILSLSIGMLFQLILPFLTQSMVDNGINTRNLQYIVIVLVAQLALTFSSTIVGTIRNRIQLRISNSVNISILSDFWIKLTRLPLSYFDLHHAGDIIQRIGDNRQVQAFMTGQTITTLFSAFNFLIYSVILVLYNTQLFLVFTVGNLLYFGWIYLFMGIRRKLNYATFSISAKENTATLQLVQGMQEIRLNNAEKIKRWEWEDIQAKIFGLNFRSMNYAQWQSAGALFINQGKDILISFMVAQMVVESRLTFGAMLAIQYIIGQLTGPVHDFIGFIQSMQDTRISMERLNEIHAMEDEEPAEKSFVHQLPHNKSVILDRLSFTYPGAGNDPVLKDITLNIEAGKVTAIVGVSGSGKTTLLKLLLKIYEQFQGEIRIGDRSFRTISPSFWRRQCGAVLQDGYIFNDTIGRNIAVGDEGIDHEKLIHSCRVANIISFIETLPNGFNTKLGADGMGISQGQRQRLLIARAVYKDPNYFFFDEATNALDANNEKEIVENLRKIFKGRTVLIIAHRLSTVMDADKIVVLHEGKIVEEGTHVSLTAIKGKYYELVKNQLELGK